MTVKTRPKARAVAEWAPDGAEPETDPGPSIFAAIQEQPLYTA
jgi:hypothetical protein